MPKQIGVPKLGSLRKMRGKKQSLYSHRVAAAMNYYPGPKYEALYMYGRTCRAYGEDLTNVERRKKGEKDE